MKPIVLGLLEDLRAKKLWPVALALAVALVAVPVLLREPAAEPVTTADPAATGTATAPGGLPGPEEALGEDGQALVTLATLRRPSDLESFDTKNPFKPLQELDGSGATELALAQSAEQGSSGTGSDPTGGDTGAGIGGGADGGGSDGGGGTNGGGPGTPGAPTDPIPTPTPTPTPIPAPTPNPLPEQRLSYAVDLTFDGPESAPRSYRNLPRLSMLPTPESPLLVFLGVGAEANDAVFLVDSSLQAVGGDAKCLPSPEECATLSIEPGEQQTFVDEQDRRYFLAIDQIREVPVRSASSSTRARAGTRARADTAVGAKKPLRRFVLPDLIDLLVTGGQR